jgi:hypothetical protein
MCRSPKSGVTPIRGNSKQFIATKRYQIVPQWRIEFTYNNAYFIYLLTLAGAIKRGGRAGKVVKTARGIIVNGIREVSIRKYVMCYDRPTGWDAAYSVVSPSHRTSDGGIERWLRRPNVDGQSNRYKQLTHERITGGKRAACRRRAHVKGA